MYYPVYGSKKFPVLRDGCEVLKKKNSQIIKDDQFIQVSLHTGPLSRDRSVVSWRVKCVVLEEINCYTNFILDNSKVHIPYLIFYLELAK